MTFSPSNSFFGGGKHPAEKLEIEIENIITQHFTSWPHRNTIILYLGYIQGYPIDGDAKCIGTGCGEFEGLRCIQVHITYIRSEAIGHSQCNHNIPEY